MKTSLLSPSSLHLRRATLLFLGALCGVVAIAACSATPTLSGTTVGSVLGLDAGESSDGATTQNGSDGGQTIAVNLDAGNADSGGPVVEVQIGTLSGRVFAPNGRLPIAGALVYLSRTKPGPIPQQAYCDKCVDTGRASAGTLTKSDGRFELKTYGEGIQYLVTQKGQFRRVRQVQITAGAMTTAEENTTFPSRTSGDDTAPLMAVVAAEANGYDRIEGALEKMGITQYDIITSQNALSFVQSSTQMQKYHVVFLPCGAGGVANCGDDRMAAASTKSALRSFVASGGKLYVTDFSYEYLNQAWPGYTNWTAQKQGVISVPPFGEVAGPDWSKDGRGVACSPGGWNGEAKFNDPGIASWLTQSDVIGSGTVTLDGNYAVMASVNTVTGKDENGASVLITPKVWTEGKKDGTFIPATISFQDTCGRVLYSSYHTEPSEEGGNTAGKLTAQEASLLYILLEVNSCVGVQ